MKDYRVDLWINGKKMFFFATAPNVVMLDKRVKEMYPNSRIIDIKSICV